MASLKDKANNILSDKSTNLLPENIKKDTTILGVVGTLEPQTTTFYSGHRVTDISSNFNAEYKNAFIFLDTVPNPDDIVRDYKVLLYIYGVISYESTTITDYNVYKNWSISFRNKNDEELLNVIPNELYRDSFYSGFPHNTLTGLMLGVGNTLYWQQGGVTDENLSQITKIVITDTTLE